VEWRSGLYYTVVRRCDVTQNIALIGKYSFLAQGEEVGRNGEPNSHN
jgi:hypothetical protein